MKQDKINSLLQQLLVEESFVQEGLQSQLESSLERTEQYTEALKTLSDAIVPEEEESVIKTVTELPDDCPYKPDELSLILEFTEIGLEVGDKVYIAEVTETDRRYKRYKGSTLSVEEVDTLDSTSPIKFDVPYGWWVDISEGSKLYRVLKPKGDK